MDPILFLAAPGTAHARDIDAFYETHGRIRLPSRLARAAVRVIGAGRRALRDRRRTAQIAASGAPA